LWRISLDSPGFVVFMAIKLSSSLHFAETADVDSGVSLLSHRHALLTLVITVPLRNSWAETDYPSAFIEHNYIISLHFYCALPRGFVQLFHSCIVPPVRHYPTVSLMYCASCEALSDSFTRVLCLLWGTMQLFHSCIVPPLRHYPTVSLMYCASCEALSDCFTRILCITSEFITPNCLAHKWGIMELLHCVLCLPYRH
jgi:hypothetical protein